MSINWRTPASYNKKGWQAFDPVILIDYIRSMKSSSLNNLAF